MKTVPTGRRINAHTATALLTPRQSIPYAHNAKDSTPKATATVRTLRKPAITAAVLTATTIIVPAQTVAKSIRNPTTIVLI